MKGITIILAMFVITTSNLMAQDYRTRNHKLNKKNYHKEVLNQDKANIIYVQSEAKAREGNSKGIVRHKKLNSISPVNAVIINPFNQPSYVVSSDKTSRKKYPRTNRPEKSDDMVKGKRNQKDVVSD
ncbi:MAG: hypothetical protein ACNS62_12625 [Candidatus Cyclobacteriaceae bacterium M3_2C_046]